MGYPMTYQRVIGRNGLHGGYDDPPRPLPASSAIAGDLRRLEHDQRDPLHLDLYARKVGITPEQVKCVLDLFFEGVTSPSAFDLSFEEYAALYRQHFPREYLMPGSL